MPRKIKKQKHDSSQICTPQFWVESPFSSQFVHLQVKDSWFCPNSYQIRSRVHSTDGRCLIARTPMFHQCMWAEHSDKVWSFAMTDETARTLARHLVDPDATSLQNYSRSYTRTHLRTPPTTPHPPPSRPAHSHTNTLCRDTEAMSTPEG